MWGDIGREGGIQGGGVGGHEREGGSGRGHTDISYPTQIPSKCLIRHLWR